MKGRTLTAQHSRRVGRRRPSPVAGTRFAIGLSGNALLWVRKTTSQIYQSTSATRLVGRGSQLCVKDFAQAIERLGTSDQPRWRPSDLLDRRVPTACQSASSRSRQLLCRCTFCLCSGANPRADSPLRSHAVSARHASRCGPSRCNYAARTRTAAPAQRQPASLPHAASCTALPVNLHSNLCSGGRTRTPSLTRERTARLGGGHAHSAFPRVRLVHSSP